MKKLLLTALSVLAAISAADSARAAADTPFFFIQLSDPQLGMFTENKDFAQDAANFEFAVAAVNR